MVNTQLKILRVFGPTGAEVSSVLRGIRDDGCPGLRLLERDGEFAICVQVSAPNRAMAEQYCDKWAARLRAKFGDDVFAEGETSLAQATLDALLEKLAEEGYNVGKINVDDEGELAERYHVMNIPTLIIFKNGEEKERMVGVQSKDLLESKLKALA